jgi:hypothetical protein
VQLNAGHVILQVRVTVGDPAGVTSRMSMPRTDPAEGGFAPASIWTKRFETVAPPSGMGQKAASTFVSGGPMVAQMKLSLGRLTPRHSSLLATEPSFEKNST